MKYVLLTFVLLFVYQNVAHDVTSKSASKTERVLRMSQIARHHLSDEQNPNNFPRMLGIPFAGMSYSLKLGTRSF